MNFDIAIRCDFCDWSDVSGPVHGPGGVLNRLRQWSEVAELLVRNQPDSVSTENRDSQREPESSFRYATRSRGSANRDPEALDKPGTIDLNRKVPRRHVAFGRGIHHCVGASLARVEAWNVLSVLLARANDITLDPQHSPKWANSLMVRRHEELPVQLVAS
jgi:hypothetical protein